MSCIKTYTGVMFDPLNPDPQLIDILDVAHDVYALVDQYPEWELNHYGQILEENGLRWDSKTMSGAIVEDLDARCICALLVSAVRAERFCDGALMAFFKDGSIKRWLQRLLELDQ